MRLKGIYAGRPALFQLLTLLLFMLVGAILSTLIGTGIQWFTYGLHGDITRHPGSMRLLQLISALGTFLLPTLLTAWTCSERPEEYLSIRKVSDARLWPLVFACVVLLSPTISLLSLLNEQMRLPAFMAPVEEWMRAQEELMKQMTEILIGNGNASTLVANLIVVAVAAGVNEEFLFRGALQRIIGRWTDNPHVIIWSAAILFSAFHLQFYGFLPRMVLGAYFGYLLFWSRSIWIPVFAHFTNNALAVIAMSDSRLKDSEFVTGDIPREDLLQFSLVAAFTLILFISVNLKLIKRTKGL